MTLGSPPENPEYTSEPKVLTPVSPKPLHYPVPSNIPVLENQIDPVFNLTTSHMAEAAPQQPQSQLDSSFTAEYPSNGASQTSPNYDMSNQTAGQDVSSSAGEGSGEAQVQQAGANSQMSYDPARYQATEASSEHDRLQASQNPPPPLSASSAHEPTPTSSDVDTQRQPLSLFSIITQSQPNGVTASGADNTGGIDYQQLLQTLSPSTANPSQTEGAALPSTAFDTSNTQPPPPGVDSSSATAVSGPPAGLPPRPPPQEQPSIHPNYTHAKDIRDYHPHSQHPALNPTSQQSNAYRSTSQSYPAAPYQAVPGANGLPPPPLASFQQQSAPYPSQSQSPNSQARAREVLESQREIKQAAGEILDDDDAPWTPERQRQYDNFLDEERRYVTEGNWEQFPHGSRLFVGKKIEKFNKPVQTADGATGNLSSEKVTKRDIFHVFSNYGSLAQISIKQAYGFVQFLSTDDCTRALQAQQGRIIRGKKIRKSVRQRAVSSVILTLLKTLKSANHKRTAMTQIAVVHARQITQEEMRRLLSTATYLVKEAEETGIRTIVPAEEGETTIGQAGHPHHVAIGREIEVAIATTDATAVDHVLPTVVEGDTGLQPQNTICLFPVAHQRTFPRCRSLFLMGSTGISSSGWSADLLPVVCAPMSFCSRLACRKQRSSKDRSSRASLPSYVSRRTTKILRRFHCRSLTVGMALM